MRSFVVRTDVDRKTEKPTVPLRSAASSFWEWRLCAHMRLVGGTLTHRASGSSFTRGHRCHWTPARLRSWLSGMPARQPGHLSGSWAARVGPTPQAGSPAGRRWPLGPPGLCHRARLSLRGHCVPPPHPWGWPAVTSVAGRGAGVRGASPAVRTRGSDLQAPCLEPWLVEPP